MSSIVHSYFHYAVPKKLFERPFSLSNFSSLKRDEKLRFVILSLATVTIADHLVGFQGGYHSFKYLKVKYIDKKERFILKKESAVDDQIQVEKKIEALVRKKGSLFYALLNVEVELQGFSDQERYEYISKKLQKGLYHQKWQACGLRKSKQTEFYEFSIKSIGVFLNIWSKFIPFAPKIVTVISSSFEKRLDPTHQRFYKDIFLSYALKKILEVLLVRSGTLKKDETLLHLLSKFSWAEYVIKKSSKMKEYLHLDLLEVSVLLFGLYLNFRHDIRRYFTPKLEKDLVDCSAMYPFDYVPSEEGCNTSYSFEEGESLLQLLKESSETTLYLPYKAHESLFIASSRLCSINAALKREEIPRLFFLNLKKLKFFQPGEYSQKRAWEDLVEQLCGQIRKARYPVIVFSEEQFLQKLSVPTTELDKNHFSKCFLELCRLCKESNQETRFLFLSPSGREGLVNSLISKITDIFGDSSSFKEINPCNKAANLKEQFYTFDNFLYLPEEAFKDDFSYWEKQDSPQKLNQNILNFKGVLEKAYKDGKKSDPRLFTDMKKLNELINEMKFLKGNAEKRALKISSTFQQKPLIRTNGIELLDGLTSGFLLGEDYLKKHVQKKFLDLRRKIFTKLSVCPKP